MATVSTNPTFHAPSRAKIEDLYRVEGKAELVGGRIIRSMANGFLPGKVAMRIAMRLDQYASQVGCGEAMTDGVGYAIRPPLPSDRESFQPDASYYVGPLPPNKMRFIEGAPTLAVEVRSENDYGPAAEREMAAKRADYFEAGTLVVWDVDPLARTIASYTSDDPRQPTVFRSGQVASAEPAAPSWQVAVDDIFGPAA